MARTLLAVVFVIAVTPAAVAQDAGEAKRPAALVPLYISQAALHALDVHSTLHALEGGHREVNPIFKGTSAGTLIGAKVASTALSVWLAEKLWKKHRVVSVVVMAGVNAGLAAVVANNYRVANTPARR